MLKNYLKIAFRNLGRNKVYSAINIGGLAVGMAVAILNGLWIWDELSFNRYHQQYDRIAQVMNSGIDGGKNIFFNKGMSYPLGVELKTNYSQYFEHLVRTSGTSEHILSANEMKLSRRGLFIDEEGPEMLTLKMVRGSRAGLKDPHSIMLSASTAEALFKDSDPIGKLIKIGNKLDVKVTGVFEDLPLNTQFHNVRFYVPWELYLVANPSVMEDALDDWSSNFVRIYAQIKPNADFKQVSGAIRNAAMQNLSGFPDLAAEKPQLFLEPMKNWHLFSYNREGIDKEPVRQVWLVGLSGLFVLLLACINFMNLNTARSEKRAKEVGIRKAIGSQRGQLVSQFFSESFLVVTLAFIVSLWLVMAALPWFNEVAGKQISMQWSNPWFWAGSLCFILITGLVAGSYPALYLSSFQPIKVLKGFSAKSGMGDSVISPRKVLVVFQFTVSVMLMIGTIVVYRQIKFAKDRPIGYSRDGLLMIQMKSEDYYVSYERMRAEFMNTGVVTDVSQSLGPVTSIYSGSNGFNWKGKDPALDGSFSTLTVTHDHGKTVGWQFVQGRDFLRKLSTDSTGIVINEAAARYMGLEHPVGETITWKWQEDPLRTYTILGVVKDMVMGSPYKSTGPGLFFIKGPNGSVNWINIRINQAVSAAEALPKIEAAFKQLIPTAPFDYVFADQEYARKFAAEERVGKLAGFFAILAILISCLGVFGLASFTAEQRVKEIGIRKVLGASVLSLWQLLSKEFVWLAIIALVIASPISYYLMTNWLQKYEYRTELSWWIFLVTSLSALLITLGTVSYQAIRMALINPVKSLRSE